MELNKSIKCPICFTEILLNKMPVANQDQSKVECLICGQYIIENSLLYENRQVDQQNAYLISAVIKESNNNKEDLILISEKKQIYDLIKDKELNDIESKIKKILLYLHSKTRFLGDKIPFYVKFHYPLAFAKNSAEAKHLIKLMIKRELIEEGKDSSLNPVYSLTAEGHSYISELKKDISKSKMLL